MVVSALKWVGDVDGCLELVDQRKLPGEFVKFRCQSIEDVFDSIKELVVRGAPAIGVAGAFGLVLGLRDLDEGDTLDRGLNLLKKGCEKLASVRPTAVNLSWALHRVTDAVEKFVLEGTIGDCRTLRKFVLEQAGAIYDEDVDMCRRIGLNGRGFIKDGGGILTHCNAGALATAGQGTALSVLFEAKKSGRKFTVYVDETRPVLQGARLTAWELRQADIDTVVICDNMAGWLIKQGLVDVVITGADRIAANGDVANKIGTYSLSVLARENGVSFYVAAPSSTFDLALADGAQIPIEHRKSEEVTNFGTERITPECVGVYNPAFDITDAADITAIITERGVIERPNKENIAKHFER